MTDPHDTSGAGSKALTKEMRSIVDDETDIDTRKERVIRQLGWVYSCDYPDCCWRWGKAFKGKTITDSADGAFSLEYDLSNAEDEE